MSTTKLIEMLRYKRPEGSDTQRDFCVRYLEPVMGLPDAHGNFTKIVYDEDNPSLVPDVVFAAHHDTVHNVDGMQEVLIKDNVASAVGSNCLGADCTTGVYLILEMIDAGIPGVYVVHAAEEVGCKGSRALVEDAPFWMKTAVAVISFDRYGTKSVITHQMGYRTASDSFANSLASILGMPQLQPDPTGSYTDSNEYADAIPECTNLSVGYYSQHTSNETQDLAFVVQLRDALIDADWSKLVIERNPEEVEDMYSYRDYLRDDDNDYLYNYPVSGTDYGSDNYKALLYVVDNYPEDIAWYLDSIGVSVDVLLDELGLVDNTLLNITSGNDKHVSRKKG